MAGNVKAVPEGFHTLTPHVVVRDATKAIEFYKRAFGAQELGAPHLAPGGKVMHASLKIGDSVLMLNDEFPEWGIKSPLSFSGSAVTLNIYVENVDALFNQAVAAGAKVTMPLQNQFWGDRYGKVDDPFGHHWSVAQHVEDVAPEELERRGREAMAQMAKGAHPGQK